MTHRFRTTGASLLLTAAALLWSAAPAHAQHRGGGYHGGGYHGGGYHGGGYYGGYHGGGYYGGYHGGGWHDGGWGYPLIGAGIYWGLRDGLGSWPGYYGNYYAPSYTYVPDGTYTPAPTLYSQGYYGAMPQSPAPLDSTPPAGAAPVLVRVHVPADAQVSFNGIRTSQTGPDRLFQSPPIPAGQRYSYEVEARWMQDGREVRQSRTVEVQPGQPATVDFTQPVS